MAEEATPDLPPLNGKISDVHKFNGGAVTPKAPPLPAAVKTQNLATVRTSTINELQQLLEQLKCIEAEETQLLEFVTLGGDRAKTIFAQLNNLEQQQEVMLDNLTALRQTKVLQKMQDIAAGQAKLMQAMRFPESPSSHSTPASPVRTPTSAKPQSKLAFDKPGTVVVHAFEEEPNEDAPDFGKQAGKRSKPAVKQINPSGGLCGFAVADDLLKRNYDD